MCPCWITIQTTNDWAGVRYRTNEGSLGLAWKVAGVGGGKCLQNPSSEGPVRNSADNGNFYSLSVNNFLFCRGGISNLPSTGF